MSRQAVATWWARRCCGGPIWPGVVAGRPLVCCPRCASWAERRETGAGCRAGVTLGAHYARGSQTRGNSGRIPTAIASGSRAAGHPNAESGSSAQRSAVGGIRATRPRPHRRPGASVPIIPPRTGLKGTAGRDPRRLHPSSSRSWGPFCDGVPNAPNGVRLRGSLRRLVAGGVRSRRFPLETRSGLWVARRFGNGFGNRSTIIRSGRSVSRETLRC